MTVTPKSQRKGQRYLKFKLHGNRLTKEKLEKQLWKSVLSYVGEKEAGSVDFRILEDRYRREKGEGIIKVRREYQDEFRAAVTLRPPENCIWETKTSSGTLKNI